MTRSISSAFWSKLQEESIQICELIELDLKVQKFYWTTANVNITYGSQVYEPFPGQSTGGIEESSDMGVSVTDFMVSNSGNSFAAIIDGISFEMGDIVVKRVFVDTPDLGSMTIYRGRIGDYAHNRDYVKGQARNAWNSADTEWPFYSYQDGCAWRFGSNGCGFNVAAVTVSAVSVVGVSTDRRTITVASGTTTSYAADHFTKGKMTFLTGANSGQSRSIFNQTGDVFGLYASLPSTVSSGDTVAIAPGCRKRIVEDCTSKYNNAANFLGFPWIPMQENVL